VALAHYLKVLPQYLIPQHTLSSAIHWLATRQTPWLKNTLIRGFIRLYDINLEEAAQPDPQVYPNFNTFFTRALKPEARPIADTPLVSPADGTISQAGHIDQNRLIQAKCHDYTLEALLGGDVHYAEQFKNGAYAVIYLSPRDYHRIHMPCDGQITAMTYIPGDLFAVNPATVATVEGLFARNERLILRIDTETGPLCLVMVGALFVGSMETVWAGKVTPPYRPTLHHEDYRDRPHAFSKGEEIGRFNMGSTVILLTPPGSHDALADLNAPTPIKMGAPLQPETHAKGGVDETDHSHY